MRRKTDGDADHRLARAIGRRATCTAWPLCGPASDNRSAHAQDAQGNGREVISAPMPLDLPPPQDRAARAENEEVISFPRALALVSGQNPQIAFANEQVEEAFAQLRGAQVLWLPSIQAGVNYINHDGPLQNSDGTITAASRSALEAGLGMYAVGGGAPAIPGVSAKFALADAVFQPRIADQQAAARQHAAAAATHDLLLFTAVAYLDLLRAFQQQAIAQETLNHAERLAELTAAFARSGQGNQADADRAQTELALRRNALAQAAAQTQHCLGPPGGTAASASRLASWCREEPTIVPIELVSHDARVAQLVAEGLSRRPELAQSRPSRGRGRRSLASRAVRAAVAQSAPGREPKRIRRRTGLHSSATIAGDLTSTPPPIGNSATLAWRTPPPAKAARSRLEQSRQLQIRLMDQVAREIVEAHAQAESLRGQIAVARVGNPRGGRIVPAEFGTNPRRPRIAAGSAPVAPSARPKPPRVPAGGRRL